jgi:hypothetical protein
MSNKNSDSISPVEILLALADNQGDRQIASWSFQKLITPKKLLEEAGLPKSLGSKPEIFIGIIKRFINQENNPSIEQVNLIINCLQEMPAESQVHGVESLLIRVSKEIAGEFSILVNWVKQNYGISIPNSRWEELSLPAKIAFQNWIGALNYGYFVKLVKILLDKLDVPDWERNQLTSRRDFWWNYSDRFERIRILLPQSSKEAIGSEFEHQDISILDEDGSDPTEVCIFDFGDCCIVEFFRGPGSETRVFDSRVYPHIKTQLFDSPEFSLKRLRCLRGEVHDHKYLWQGYCEKLLRTRDIYPNQGTQYFKGLYHPYNQYNSETGLPVPSLSEQEERQRKLEYWEREMKKIKREADLFCGQFES